MCRHQDAEAERAIAIVGAACRFPGGISGLDELWVALRQGRDLVSEVPADRFQRERYIDTAMPRTGRSYTAAGGFLDDITGFDAAYFGISPKEAAQMDPQHRLLLELTAEALDDAAIDSATLAGSDTAVYVGISDASYGALQMASLRTVNAYTMSGAASSIAANRLSHAFDLHGPSMAIDTACSSSLVALDRACHTLWANTSRAALCGGANILLSPFHYVGFSQASMLSVRGKCAAFSAHADGFVRAEGGGMVLLKRLGDALTDGDRIHGVILGSGSNSDGKTMGLSLPNPVAQEELLRRVYAESGVHPDELVYFEAHGTGTPVGDPLEATAIGRALGIRRTASALPIGSVKTNVGHLEPASGMAGLCKALLVLRHHTVPPSLHADPPHPDIDFTGLGLSVTSDTRALPATERPTVGVNSFGFGGSNAHVILTSAPPRTEPSRPEADSWTPPAEGLPVLVSARSAGALTEAVNKTAQRLLAAAPEEFYDLAYTSCMRRGKHEHRAVVLAQTPDEAAREFTALAGEAPPGESQAVQAHAVGATAKAVTGGRVAFVFSGNGSQWAGMGADLLAQDTVFRETVMLVDRELTPLLGWSVAEELAAAPERWRLAATEVAQPLLFTVQVAVVAMLRAYGVEPCAALGHSVGEVAAAHTSGALSLAQAAQVIAERSRVQADTAGTGRMAAVGLAPEQLEDELTSYQEKLEIAGINSPQDVTISGDAASLAALGVELDRRGVFFRDLGLDYAFHSRAMDGQRERLTQALADLEPAHVTIPFYSTVTGMRARGTELDAEYWWHNIRQPVHFFPAVERAVDGGADIFLEIGPHPVLRTYLRRIAAKRPWSTVAVLPTLRRDTDGPRGVTTALATLIATGANIDWNRYFPRPGRVADLPAYPWQRERHWCGTPQSWVRTSGNGQLQHPLLGERLPAPLPVWEGTIEPPLVPWLTDHRVAGSVVMPATGFVEMALAAGRAVLGGPVEIEHLDISNALVVPWADATSVRTQVSFEPDAGTVAITSTDSHTGDQSGDPRPHVRAQVRSQLHRQPAPLDLDTLRQRCPRRVEAAEHYASCAAAGLRYGPSFQVLRDIRVGGDEVVATYRHDAPGDPYTVHPALLDGALQAGAPLLARRLAEGHAYLPAAMDSVRLWGTPAESGAVLVRERSRTEGEVCWDITLTDDNGAITAQLEGCRLRRLTAAQRTPLSICHTVLRAAPHSGAPCGPSPLPSPERIATAARQRITELREGWRDFHYEAGITPHKELTARSLAAAIAGLLPDPAGPFSLDDLVSAGMSAQHRRLIALLAPLMERHGVLAGEHDGQWRLTAAEFPTSAIMRETLTTLPWSATYTALAAQQARHLEGVLRGAVDPLELIASEATAAALEQFYDTFPVTRFHSRLAQALLTEMLRHWPTDRTLRVLEIGAGTGGTAAALLPLLPADRTRYYFSDISPLFFTRAQSRFIAYDFVEYRTFDLDADPAEQGYAEHSFDLVVAANSLHTAEDLDAALRRVTTLLAPGGQLLGIETHDAETLAPIFGTLDSFYSNTDTALRPDSLLLPRDQWPVLLERCGFTGVIQTGDDQEPARDHYSLFLAATPSGSPEPPSGLPARRADTAFVIAAESPEADGGGTDGAAADPLAPAVADTLAADGTSVRTAPASTDAQDWGCVLGDLSTSTVSITLILSSSSPGEPAELVAQATRRAATLRAIASACAHLPSGVTAELWLVTRVSGALPVLGECTHPADAAPWGVARCLANEQPDLVNRRVMLHRSADVLADARRLVRELLSQPDEDEIVLTSHDRFVPRERERPAARPTPMGTAPFRLRVRNPGLMYQLVWEETRQPEPGPGEVVIEVRAAALNYRDLMQSAGLLPSEIVDGIPPEEGLGLECAGVVTACGPGVIGLKPGDRVAGVAQAALASHTMADARAVWRLPPHISFAAAATAPVAFATVHYSLGHLAQLRPGETVLVHGAAGGVGLAAIQYAKARGARVIATAGSDLKRALLDGLGVDHVLDSRTLDFAVQVKELTEGQGVDVVLNSLAGEAIARGLGLLRTGGRFLELGKRDMYENKPLPLRPFNNNIAFFGVNLMKLIHDPLQLSPLLDEVSDLIMDGDFHPLPHSVYPAARVDEAFRLMQRSRHIGKVIVAFDPLDEPPLVQPILRAPRLNAEGTYLITGGTSGFGAATASWLADLGARHLALVSRRGAEAPEAAPLLTALAERGVQATPYAADAADPAAMRNIVDRIDTSGHPLRGAVHCAMHLDDAPLADLSDDRLAAVMAPKMGGAAVLDSLTRDRECDLFLLYSSYSATFGNLKQAPYNAGNLYLEALVRQRQQSGNCGQALAWGAIGETGYVVRSELTESLAGLGIELLTPGEAFSTAERLLAAQANVTAVIRGDWARMSVLLPLLDTPRVRDLVPARGQTGAPSLEELSRTLASMSSEEALAFLMDTLTQLLADALNMDPSQLEPHRRLDEYGLDSLMGAQVLVTIHQRYGIEIPPLELLRSNGTVADIAQIIQLRLGISQSPDAAPQSSLPSSPTGQE
ncbi:type I polyketide synthase [Streptomyces gobiensis]|uniref:type I polyketide synthase n=1 Tax=Streptomyces gobiensis TaxID=2875706 RepID=UPI001E3CE675|nr:type I polyketide synthase [Streptomyces gobiensis]UGY93248.1 SDR family NAD(P)-dependent oxidoreductase [Streptomyces gobiensis]